MSSAWLIRRFIDPDARFGFVPDRDAAPSEAVPFDMFGVELTYQGEWCTFETLCGVFGIDDAAVHRLAGIVHDLDAEGRPIRRAGSAGDRRARRRAAADVLR